MSGYIGKLSGSASKQRKTAPSSPGSQASSPRLSFDDVIQSPESQTDPGLVEDPSPPPPREGVATRGSSRGSAPLVETVEEAPNEEEEEEKSASERDGDLSEPSSAGESIPGVSRPVETVDLVDLQGRDKCRQICFGTLSDGSKARLCCGRTVAECNQHAKNRVEGTGRGRQMWCVRVIAARGLTVHGLGSESRCTQAEHDELRAAEREEMRTIARELEEQDDSDEEEPRAPVLGRDAAHRSVPVVNFAGRADTFRTPPRFPSPPRGDFEEEMPPEVAREIAKVVQQELAKNASATARGAGVALADAAPPRAPAPEVLDAPVRGRDAARRSVPVVNSAGRAETFSTPPRVHSPLRGELEDMPPEIRRGIAKVVQTEIAKNASAALRTGVSSADAAPPRAPAPEVLDVEDDSLAEERAPRKIAKAKRHVKVKPALEWLGLIDPRGDRVIRQEARGGATLERGWRLKKYFKDRSTARLWLSPSGISDSDPSSSSSSSASESSSSSSSSATNPKRSSKKKKKKKKEKKLSSYRGTDSSTGDDKRIHGFEVSGIDIDKALAPAGLSTKDGSSIVEAALDVAASPGVFSATHSQLHDEVQGVTEAATTMLATLAGKRAQLHDTQWKTQRKNSLGSVKKASDLFTLLEAVEEASAPAFEQQDSRIRSFLYQRKFDEDAVTDYLEHGLLPTIIRRSHDYFVALLNRIRGLYHKNNDTWDEGPAKAMLDHHTKGLANVRAFSIDYRTLILKVHVHLREAASKKFFHTAMSEVLWTRMARLESPHDVQPPPSAGDPKCSHCRSKEIHAHLGLLPARNHCPFLGLRVNSLSLKKALKQSGEVLSTHPGVEAAKASITEIVRLLLASP